MLASEVGGNPRKAREGCTEPDVSKGSRSSKDEGQADQRSPSGILSAPSQQAQMQKIHQEIEVWIEGLAKG
jgi:hypothetical protein